MKRHLALILLSVLLLSSPASANSAAEAETAHRWHMDDYGGIHWDLEPEEKLPHSDHMAMSGRSVDLILEWNVDSEGRFQATRVVRWPMLRTLPDDTHASLSMELADSDEPQPLVEGQPLSAGMVQQVRIHGMLIVASRHREGLWTERTIFPSPHAPAIIDLCRLENTGPRALNITIPAWRTSTVTAPEAGLYGSYTVEQILVGDTSRLLAPGESISWAIVRSARKKDDAPFSCDPEAELAAREKFVDSIEADLVLETPDGVLNQLFAFSKLRGAESIFATRGGLMHGPGGYNKYLAAIWANDQAEYINPFFPFLGNTAGNESAMNAFRHFAAYMNPEYKPIPSSIIAEGRGFWNGAGDRGDAAMIAYGAGRFALASGNRQWAEELWPLISWCLEYCHRNTTAQGVITSDTDELEGRFPAGEANLCTSCLCYDALLSAAWLAEELGKDRAGEYRSRATALRETIDKRFTAEVEGYPTYRYFKGNAVLRSWICIPLSVGIFDRAEGTIDALFSDRLWTRSGLLTQAGTETVWDRATLYALRGIIASGGQNRALEKLSDFSRWRLLGDHVPYVIEAFPEFHQSHLSAESGLYCRIITEGLFGIRPTGLRSFQCVPRLPEDWSGMKLRRVKAFGRTWDMLVQRRGKEIEVLIRDAAGNDIYRRTSPDGEVHHVDMKPAAVH
jgi:hypothetical protein